MKIILARKILPVTAPYIDNGALVIDGGRIAGIGGRRAMLRRFPDAEVTDLGGLLVMPGLVNAHAHLELSHLQGKIGEHADFFGWIAALIELGKTVGDKGRNSSINMAVRQAVATGTTCIGDISATEKAVPALVRSGLRAVVYLEVIGMDPDVSVATFDRLTGRMKRLGGLPDRICTGISPHSPYSVSSNLYSMLRDDTSGAISRLSVHLSETFDEFQYIQGKPSGMDGYMANTGWDSHQPNRGSSPASFINDMGLLSTGMLAVHAVHLSKPDMNLLAASGASVAHCPRSNHMLGVGRAPVKELIRRGVNVAIGTDSLASNMDIDMWEEMRFAYLVNGLTAEQVIRMATVNGARALRLDGVTGSLEPGKSADFIAVRTDAARDKDPSQRLLYGTHTGDVMLSVVQGKTIYISDGLKGRS